MRNLIHEIHRRSLWQVLGIYVAVSWLVLQVVDVLVGNFGLPEWVAPAALILLLLGLPIVLATAFVQEGIGSAVRDASGGAGAESGPDPAPASSAPGGRHRKLLTWRNALVGGGGAFALLGLLTAAYLFMRAAGIGPAGTLVAKGILEDRERLVLADFESATDTVLATTVTETVRRALAESSALRFVDRSDLDETLRRMGRDPRAVLVDRETAREIAVRDGLKGFVGGVVDRVGTGYVLSADLVLAETGETALSHQESARDDSDLIDAIDRLSRRFRERAGESLRDVNASPRLAAVTTSSLAALQKYVQGSVAYNRLGDPDRAIGLYEEAVGIDTAFAMAWRALGVVYGNRGRRSLLLDVMDRAMRHQDRLSDLERAELQAFYHATVTRDREAAVAAYQRALDADPDSSEAALNNLAVQYQALRRFEEAEATFSTAVARGSQVWQTHSGVVRMRYALGDRDGADAALRHAREVVPELWRWDVMEATLLVADGDYDRADSAAASIEAKYGREPAVALGVPLARAQGARRHGRLAEAEGHLRRRMELMRGRGLRSGYLGQAVSIAMVRLEADDRSGGRAVLDEALRVQPLDSIPPLDRPYSALVEGYAAVGDPARAQSLLEEWERAVDPEADDPLGTERARATGFVALAAGRPEEAIDRFRESDRATGCPICRLPEIGLAYDRAGQTDSVVALYERFLDTPWWSRADADQERGRILERLGQLHDERGDLQSAAKYFAMFVELWADADEVLQPRVRTAQARLEAILREIG